MSKTILITGASSGLGKSVARLFAKKGWTVIATMRDPSAETELSKLPGVQVLKLDVNDPGEILETIAAAERISPIDILFNNAGYVLAGPLEGSSDEEIEAELTTNFLGTIRVTKAVLPYFRARRAGVFITTTSTSAYIPDPFMSVYSASKAALTAWSGAMSFELEGKGIATKTIVPGLMQTSLVQNARIVHMPEYQDDINKVLAFFSNPQVMAGADNPDDIAEVVFEAATDGKKQLYYIAGKDASRRFEWLETLGIDKVVEAAKKMFFDGTAN